MFVARVLQIGPVREYVKMLCENRGLKFLVFAYHHCMMDGIAEELYDLNIKYIRIDGQTVGSERPVITSLIYLFHLQRG